jgi:hypothetical protein
MKRKPHVLITVLIIVGVLLGVGVLGILAQCASDYGFGWVAPLAILGLTCAVAGAKWLKAQRKIMQPGRKPQTEPSLRQWSPVADLRAAETVLESLAIHDPPGVSITAKERYQDYPLLIGFDALSPLTCGYGLQSQK